MPVYMPGDPWISGQFASILAIGDSWFWYPTNNILGALSRHRRLLDPYRNIQAIGFNGAKLEEYAFGKYADRIAHELEPRNRQYYSAVMISGAGNDAVDYRLGLFKDCSAASDADQCINNASMDALISRIGTALSALLEQILRAYAHDPKNKQPSIFLHTYDYPVPDDRGFDLAGLQITGPWLGKAMDECQVPNDMDLRKKICIKLIDRLAAEFKRQADEFNGILDPTGKSKRIHLIDSTGCLSTAPSGYKKDWANELHPTSRGFDKIVTERWIPELVKIGMAK